LRQPGCRTRNINNKIAGLPKIKKIFDNPAFLCGMESSRKGGNMTEEA